VIVVVIVAVVVAVGSMIVPVVVSMILEMFFVLSLKNINHKIQQISQALDWRPTFVDYRAGTIMNR